MIQDELPLINWPEIMELYFSISMVNRLDRGEYTITDL